MNWRALPSHFGAWPVRLRVAWAICAAGAATLAQAQMADPTRPPPEALLLSAPGEAAAPAGPQLQSVLVSTRPGGRRVAVIDGQTVRLGGQFDGAVLVKLNDHEAVLRRGAALQTLRLYPSLPSPPLPPSAAPASATPVAAKGTPLPSKSGKSGNPQ